MVEGNAGPVEELLVPVRAADPDDRGAQAARRLARARGCPIRLLHVRPTDATGPEPDPAPLVDELQADLPGRVTWEVASADDVAPAVLAHASPGSVIVMATTHASRWSGKASVSEHVLDAWSGATMLVGPLVDVSRYPAGDVLVGVDGSAASERALPVARSLAECLGGEVLVTRVVPDPDARPDPSGVDPRAEEEARAHLTALTASRPGTRHAVVRSNDPISALVGTAGQAPVGLIVLSSRGDRKSGRSTISRVCTGVAATARQPVVVVGTPDA